MNTSKKGQGIQITQRSQLSNIDMFSKLQASFLQKFFKYNLNDYFQQIFANLYEDIFDKIIKVDPKEKAPSRSKLQKHISSSLFVAKSKFTVEEFEKNMQKFYYDHSTSIKQNQLPFAFILKHTSQRTVPNLVKPGQFVFIDIKIKAQVEKIQELPQKIMKLFQPFRLQKKGSMSQLEQIFSNYKGEYFNIFIIYFGDSNFQIFDKKKYEINSIKLLGNHFKLRIHVFFISKQALIQAFRSINKIENLQYINDLVIQFYELKRQKQRRKRVKENKNVVNKQSRLDRQKIYMLIGVCGLVGFGFALKKLFS